MKYGNFETDMDPLIIGILNSVSKLDFERVKNNSYS